MRTKPGDIIRIKLTNDSYTYCRVLDFPAIAFYDLNTHEEASIETVVNAPILFKVWVMKSTFKSASWSKIGSLPLEPNLRVSFFSLSKTQLIKNSISLMSKLTKFLHLKQNAFLSNEPLSGVQSILKIDC